MTKEQTTATGDLYSRLGINRSATDGQIQDAYYRLAKAFHPDALKCGQVDEEAFNSIVQAAAILRDPARRKLYDRGAIDEDGRLVRSSGRWSRWSYREVAFACLTAMTVLISCVVLYSRDKSGPALPPADAQAARKEESPAAGAAASREAQGEEPALAPYSRESPAKLLKALLKRQASGAAAYREASLAHPAAQGEEPAFAHNIDDNPAELLRALLRQQPVYSPAPSTIVSNQAETAPAAIAAAPEGGRDRTAQTSSMFFKNPAALQKESKLSLSLSAIIRARHPRANSRLPGECPLTPGARAILASIISR